VEAAMNRTVNGDDPGGERRDELWIHPNQMRANTAATAAGRQDTSGCVQASPRP
jgi:hypothetical protein